MKTLYRFSLATLAVAVVAAAHAASPQEEPGVRPARQSKHHRLEHPALRRQIARKLELTAEQRTAMKSARKEAAEAIKAVRSDAALSPDQKRSKAREISVEARSRIESILTPEQRAQLQQLRSRHKPQETGN